MHLSLHILLTVFVQLTYPSVESETCGKSFIKGGRVVNGVEATPNSWPWVVHIRLKHSKRGWLPWCGGVLIHRGWVLTAAHCIFDRIDGKRVDYSQPDEVSRFELVLGEHNRNKQEGSEVKVNVSYITLHQFDPATFHNDIALMKITPSVKFNRYIQPICLPATGWLNPGDNTTVVGWGSMDRSGFGSSPALRQAVVPLIDPTLCNQRFYPGDILPGMLCAGFQEGHKDACRGDSGGPLFARNPQDHRYYVVGLVSWGIGCALRNRPGVYTDTVYFHPWITAVTTCDTLTAPEHSSMSHCNNTYGSFCQYSCQHGYRQTGGSTSRRCMAAGWTGTPITCTVEDEKCYQLSKPEGGRLRCTHTKYFRGICYIECLQGHFLVSAGNNYVTCGHITNYEWSHRLTNKLARLPACSRGYFTDLKLPMTLRYISRRNCRTVMPVSLLESRVHSAVNSIPECNNQCEITYLPAKCVDNGTTHIYVKFQVLLLNVRPNMVPVSCSGFCQHQNLMDLLRKAARLNKKIQFLIKTNASQFELENVDLVTVDTTYNNIFGKGVYLMCEAGHVHRFRLCVPCDRGHFVPGGSTYCQRCPVGSYQDEQGQTSCKQCKVGTTTTATGSHQPTMCV